MQVSAIHVRCPILFNCYKMLENVITKTQLSIAYTFYKFCIWNQKVKMKCQTIKV